MIATWIRVVLVQESSQILGSKVNSTKIQLIKNNAET